MILRHHISVAKKQPLSGADGLGCWEKLASMQLYQSIIWQCPLSVPILNTGSGGRDHVTWVTNRWWTLGRVITNVGDQSSGWVAVRRPLSRSAFARHLTSLHCVVRMRLYRAVLRAVLCRTGSCFGRMRSQRANNKTRLPKLRISPSLSSTHAVLVKFDICT